MHRLRLVRSPVSKKELIHNAADTHSSKEPHSRSLQLLSEMGTVRFSGNLYLLCTDSTHMHSEVPMQNRSGSIRLHCSFVQVLRTYTVYWSILRAIRSLHLHRSWYRKLMLPHNVQPLSEHSGNHCMLSDILQGYLPVSASSSSEHWYWNGNLHPTGSILLPRHPEGLSEELLLLILRLSDNVQTDNRLLLELSARILSELHRHCYLPCCGTSWSVHL